MKINNPGNEINYLLQQTRVHHMQLSSMADLKANMLLTMASIVVTLAAPQVMKAGSQAPLVVLIGFSLVLYIDVKIAPMPAEGLVGCLSEKLGKPFSQMKTAFDCTSVLVGAILCLVFLGKLVGIREGTVLTALLAGKMMGILRKWVGPWIQKLCFGE
jgi:hypothetical protein